MKKLCIFFSVKIIYVIKDLISSTYLSKLDQWHNVFVQYFLYFIVNLSSKPFIAVFLYYHLSFVNMALYIRMCQISLLLLTKSNDSFISKW
jgi:hypothetical protein